MSYFKELFNRKPKEEFPPMRSNVIGLVVGHNIVQQGAVNYLGESEWSFNSRICKAVRIELVKHNITAYIIYRPVNKTYSEQAISVAQALKAFRCYHSVHFHFNSAIGDARGVEVLVCDSEDIWDNLFGDTFSDILNERYQFIERGDDGVKTIQKGHNGWKIINTLKQHHILACVIEPVFGHLDTFESRQIFENEAGYVDILTEAIVTSLRGRYQ